MQTRRATQAAGEQHYTQDNDERSSAPADAINTAQLPTSSTAHHQAHAEQQEASVAAHTPHAGGRNVRRRICEASASEEQMVADMQAFEQQRAEGDQDYLSCPSATHSERTAYERNLETKQAEAFPKRKSRCGKTSRLLPGQQNLKFALSAFTALQTSSCSQDSFSV